MTRSHSHVGNRAARTWRPLSGVEPAEVVYGLIVSAATIGAVGLHVETNGRLVAVWAFVILTYWLAHVYVHLVARPLDGLQERFGSRIATAFRDELGVLVGALPGLGVILVESMAGGTPATAASITMMLTIGLLFALGVFAARRLGASLVRSLAEGFLASTLGIVMVLAKALLH